VSQPSKLRILPPGGAERINEARILVAAGLSAEQVAEETGGVFSPATVEALARDPLACCHAHGYSTWGLSTGMRYLPTPDQVRTRQLQHRIWTHVGNACLLQARHREAEWDGCFAVCYYRRQPRHSGHRRFNRRPK